MQVNPYLAFNGECEAAFRFYEATLGARIEMMLTHGASPIADQVPPEWKDRIMHARLSLGGSLLMGGDSPPDRHVAPTGFSVSLLVDTTTEAERVFAGLSEGGTVQMPMAETFWALRFGMATDRFGIPWMVNCPRPQ